MPKRGHLVKAYKNGDEFRKYCLLYGFIVSVHDWDDPVDGKPLRAYVLHIDGVEATIDLKAGEVTGWGYHLITAK